MKQVIFLLTFLAICVIVNAQAINGQTRPQIGQTQQPRIDPAKLTPGWHSDTAKIQINYKSLRYDPKAHIVSKYFMTPGRKPINMSAVLMDSSFKAVKPEDVSDVKN